jgi:hypothetical protein
MEGRQPTDEGAASVALLGWRRTSSAPARVHHELHPLRRRHIEKEGGSVEGTSRAHWLDLLERSLDSCDLVLDERALAGMQQRAQPAADPGLVNDDAYRSRPGRQVLVFQHHTTMMPGIPIVPPRGTSRTVIRRPKTRAATKLSSVLGGATIASSLFHPDQETLGLVLVLAMITCGLVALGFRRFEAPRAVVVYDRSPLAGLPVIHLSQTTPPTVSRRGDRRSRRASTFH